MKWFGRKKNGAETALPILSTARLVMRNFEMSDAVSVYAYAQNEKVAIMAGFAPHTSPEESRAMVQRFMESGCHWAIVEKSTGCLIGSISLQTDGKRPRISAARRMGYVLGEGHWGKGYATEACTEVLRYAFEELECPIVSADLLPANTKSKRVLKKLGFSPEGILRCALPLPDGSVSDLSAYSLLRADYEQQKQKKNKEGS